MGIGDREPVARPCQFRDHDGVGQSQRDGGLAVFVRLESDNLQLINEMPKPSWSRVLDHLNGRCPWWHAEAEKQALIEYLEREYWVDEKTWYSVIHLESARDPPPPTQRTLPGFDISHDFVSESF